MHLYYRSGIFLVIIALVKTSKSVTISNGTILKDYLCSPNRTITPNTNLEITVSTLTLPISGEELCLVENTSNITIAVSDVSENLEYVLVTCTDGGYGYAGFGFVNVTQLTIRSVHFKNCESAIPSSFLKFINESGQFVYYDAYVRMSLIFNHCYNLTLYNVLADSSSFAVTIIGVNLCGFSSIIDEMSGWYPAVTALIYYVDSEMTTTYSECSLHISTNVLTTSYLESALFYVDGYYDLSRPVPVSSFKDYALSVCIAQQTFTVLANINVNPKSAELFEHKVINILIVFADGPSGSNVTYGGYPYQTCTSNYRGELMPVILGVAFLNTRSQANSNDTVDHIMIKDTAFTNDFYGYYNTSGGIKRSLLSILSLNATYSLATIENISVCKGYRYPFRSLPLDYLILVSSSHNGSSNLIMSDIFITDHYCSEYYSQDEDMNLITLIKVDAHITGTNTFNSSGGGAAIFVESSNVTLTGNLTIIDKYLYGSHGIVLDSNSTLLLSEPLVAQFHNYRGSHGSAINANINPCYDGANSIQILPRENISVNNLTNIDIALYFKNSSNSSISTQLYAPRMNFLWDQHWLFKRTEWDSSHLQYAYTTIFDAIFREISDYDKYTSLSNGVCLQIHGQPPWICKYIDYPYYTIKQNLKQAYLHTVYVYPGGVVFSVPILDSGMEVYDYSSNTNISDSICLNPVQVKNGSVMLFKVYICDAANDSQSSPYFIDITLTIENEGINALPLVKVYIYTYCPTGFLLEIAHPCQCHCVCLPALKDHHYICDIYSQFFTAPSKYWTGFEETNSTFTIQFGKNCPPMYCRSDMVQFQLNSSLTHLSCQNNRAGVLCGDCKKNYSAMFGSDACSSDCNHLYLFTLPLYALAGLLLVVVLFALQFTVATGTINGVIFYANMLGLVINVLTEGNRGLYLKTIYIVISLLNLNLGFPVCLYQGMSPTEAVGFQFVFPVYLWSLAAGMVFLSKYSIRLSNLISKSSVQVLATLFYLSFSLLLRTVIHVLTNTTVEVNTFNHANMSTAEKESIVVWYYNGKAYGRGLHGLYFALAILFVFFYLFPFTLFTTSGSYLLRFNLVNKLRPFIDAFGGPFKDKWRFWFGLRLWITIILSVVSGVRQGSDTDAMLITHLQVIIAFIVLQAYSRPFKNLLTGLLDIAYMVNLFLVLEFYFLLSDYFISCYIALLAAALLNLVLTLLYHLWCVKYLQHCLKLPRHPHGYQAIPDSSNNSDQVVFHAAEERDSVL